MRTPVPALLRLFARFAVFGALAAGYVRPVHAQSKTVTFETLGLPDNTRITAEYEGLTWENFWILKGDNPIRAGSGYSTASVATASSWIVYNPGGLDASLSAAAEFGLESAVFAAAWENGLGLTITGYNAANGVIGVVSTTLSVTAAKVLPINLFGLRRVTFQTTRGTPVNPDTEGKQFAMDNLVVRQAPASVPSTTVPEPGSLALLTAGAVGLGLIARARRHSR